LSLEHGDAAHLDETLQTLVLACNYPLAIGRDCRNVNAIKSGGHAELCGIPGNVRYLRGVQKRFSGDAADVQAGSANLVLFNKGDTHSKLGSTECGSVTATTGSEDDKVKILLRHRATPSGLRFSTHPSA